MINEEYFNINKNINYENAKYFKKGDIVKRIKGNNIKLFNGQIIEPKYINEIGIIYYKNNNKILEDQYLVKFKNENIIVPSNDLVIATFNDIYNSKYLIQQGLTGIKVIHLDKRNNYQLIFNWNSDILLFLNNNNKIINLSIGINNPIHEINKLTKNTKEILKSILWEILINLNFYSNKIEETFEKILILYKDII